MHTNIHASSGIRNHDPSVQAGEDDKYLRPRARCDRLRLCLEPVKQPRDKSAVRLSYEFEVRNEARFFALIGAADVNMNTP
jgi:hypothetical protein